VGDGGGMVRGDGAVGVVMRPCSDRRGPLRTPYRLASYAGWGLYVGHARARIRGGGGKVPLRRRSTRSCRRPGFA